MKLEEAIKHCLEVANRKEMESEFETDCVCYAMTDKEREEYKKCAADHRQLAEWLTELKELREENINFKNEIERLRDSVDSFICNRELDFAELKEAKRLLKAAVEDIHELLCDRKNLDGIGQSCNVCSYIDNCPCCNRCDIIPELRTWRHADEVLALIGEEENP